MKKINLLKWFIPIVIVVLTVIVFILLRFNNKNNVLETKVDKEVNYLSSNLISIANKMNNISYNNYVVNKIINKDENNEKDSRKQ